MSFQIRNVVALIAVVLCFIACSRSNEEGYFPHPRDGSRWEYKLEYMAPLLGVRSGKMLVRVDGTEPIGDHTYFKYVSVLSGIPGAEPEVWFYRRSPDGILRIDGKHRDGPEYLETPFPLEVGNTWAVNGPERQAEYRVEAIETLELFDKTYDECLKISYTSTEGLDHFQGTLYLAKGIGLVKETASGVGVTFEVTLEKYER